MNKNLVKYPIRFGTLLLAGAALVACKKEEFTEKDAWNLENQRLTRLAQLKKTADSLARVEREGMFKWQRNIDSLNQINAGGRVFYTVIPVNASEAVLSGGRTEEAITGATVTATQFGRTVTGTGANGVFTFPEMRSGEVTVNVTAPNFTQVNYISNLTPDGGIANNGVVNVGNVIPMFELPGTGSNAAAKFAVIRGQAWFEGDLTDATAQEERVTPAVLGANTNLVTASIDLDRGAASGTPSWFHRRFITETMDESGTGSIVGGTIRSGAIQRFSYSRAVSYGTVDANGAYSMLVPASASGLPIRLNYSEFAFNRVYFNTNGQTVNGTGTPAITERFLYGPNVTPTAIPTPTVTRPRFEVQAFTTAAAGTATFTPQSTEAQPLTFLIGTGAAARRGTATITTAAATATGQAAVNRRRGGFYAIAPNVTVTAAGGTNATFTAALTRAASDETAAAPASLRNNTAAMFNPATADLTLKGQFETAFGTVEGVTVTAGGTGYTGNGTLNFTRTDILASGTGNILLPTGSVSTGNVALSTTSPIRVVNGGFGFSPTTIGTVEGTGAFTNYLPTVVFTKTASGLSEPSTATELTYNTADNVTPATARVFVDYDAEYNAAGTGVLRKFRDSGVGAIQEIRTISGGSYPISALPFISFTFGDDLPLTPGIAPADGAAAARQLFVSSGLGVRLNTTLTTNQLNSVFPGRGATIVDGGRRVNFANPMGGRYVFVPSVTLEPAANTTSAANVTLRTALAAVINTPRVDSNPNSANFGRITSILIGSQDLRGVTVGADGNEFMSAAPFAAGDAIGIKVTPTRVGNTLAAVGDGDTGRVPALGSSLNNYVVDQATLSTLTPLISGVGGAVSNISASLDAVTAATSYTTEQILAGNNMLVVFDAPTNPLVTAANRRTAWGVPVFRSNSNTDAVGNVLSGVRIVDGGSGYLSGTASTARLVPNPWFRGNRPAGITTPAGLTIDLTVGGVAAGLATNQDIIGFLNHPVMTAQGSVARVTPNITRARLAINVATAGSGYSRAPRFIVSGGGLNLTEYDVTSPLSTYVIGTGATATSVTLSDSPGGVLTFGSTIDAAGTVSKISGVTTTVTNAAFTGAALYQAVDANGVEILNTYEFLPNRAPAYGGVNNTAPVTLALNVVETLSVDLTRSLNNSVADGGVGAVANVAATTAQPTGEVTNVRFNRDAATQDQFLPATGYTANAPQVDIQTGTGAAVFVPGYDSPLVPGPRTILVGGTGTGATVQSWVTLDPRVAQHRRITTITVTAGGTGYGFVRLNSVSRGLGGSTIPAGGGAQAFQIFGGAANGAGNYNTLFNESNERFDAHPGRAYVRDVHYGTGVRVD